MRLAKFMAAAGLGSRRHCEALIKAGGVRVSGVAIQTPATNIDPRRDSIAYQGRELRPPEPVYLLLNKPRGYTCSAKDPHAERLITELLPKDCPRLFTVGRLDRDSEGLIICTNDGNFSQQVAHPSHEVPKTYQVTVRGSVTPTKLKQLVRGITDSGERLVAQSADHASTTADGTEIIILVIAEGRNREIRRMCDQMQWQVRRLLRTAIGEIRDPDLKPGRSRPLTKQERESLIL